MHKRVSGASDGLPSAHNQPVKSRNGRKGRTDSKEIAVSTYLCKLANTIYVVGGGGSCLRQISGGGGVVHLAVDEFHTKSWG